MLTTREIDGFYSRVDELGLKFPVAAIARATGYSKGNISDYLKKRKQPSENFLKKFYEVFPKGSTGNLANGTEKPPELLVQLMQKQNSLMEMQNRILSEMKEGVQDKVVCIEKDLKKVDSNLETVLGYSISLERLTTYAREVVLKSLARLEKKPEESLLEELRRTIQP